MGAAWFVDGGYAYKSWQAVSPGTQLDYTRLREEIEDDAGEDLRENYFFGAESDPPSAKQDGFHRAISVPPPAGPGLRLMLYWLATEKVFWPKHLGGHAIMHPEIDGLQFEDKSQKGVDVGLAFHLMRPFFQKKWNKLYLVAGDGDFGEVVQHLVKHENVAVSIIGTRGSVSPELAPWGQPIYFEDYLDRLILSRREGPHA